MAKRIFALTVAFMFVCVSAFAMCGVCGSGTESKGEVKNVLRVTLKIGIVSLPRTIKF